MWGDFKCPLCDKDLSKEVKDVLDMSALFPAATRCPYCKIGVGVNISWLTNYEYEDRNNLARIVVVYALHGRSTAVSGRLVLPRVKDET